MFKQLLPIFILVIILSANINADVFVSGIKISVDTVSTYENATNTWDGNFSNGQLKIWFIVNETGVGNLSGSLVIKQGVNTIRTINLTGLSKGVNSVLWNGYDGSNNPAPTGSYTFSITVSDPVGHTTFDSLWAAGANPDPDFDGNNTWGYRGIASTTDQTSTAFGNVYIARGTTLTTSINGLYELRADGVFKRKIGTDPIWPASTPVEVGTFGGNVYGIGGYGFAGGVAFIKGYNAESGNFIDSTHVGVNSIRDIAIRKEGNDTVFYTARSGTNALNAIIKKVGFHGDTTTHINMIPYINGGGYIKAVVFDDDGNAYVAFGEASASRKKIAKFNSSGSLVYLDSLDGVFGLTGAYFQSLAIYNGTNPNSASDDKLYAVVYGGSTGSPNSGIYSLNMNAAGGTFLSNTGVGAITTSATAIQINCDAAGNVLLSNGASQERIAAFSPANGPNSFTTEGPVTLNVTNPIPVELTSFTANVNGKIVNINWTTATETNNSGFEVQRAEKNDGTSLNFEKIGFVQGNGTTTELHSYSFTDQPSSGVYSYRLKQIDYDGTFSYSSEVEVNMSLPTQFTLEQNFPNPFNPVTTIQFGLPFDSEVSLRIFNMLGEEVSTLINNEFKSAGSHSVSFNASNLPSGTYVYRLEAGNNIVTKKMTLLK